MTRKSKRELATELDALKTDEERWKPSLYTTRWKHE